MSPIAKPARRVIVTGWAIQTIALATDLSPASELASERAVALAGRLGSRLLMINVLDRGRLSGFGAHARVDQARIEREDALVALVQRARSAGVRAEFVVWAGEPGPGIVAVAEAESADLLVVGTHAREGASRLLLGSVSDHVVRPATCPVLVVRPERPSPTWTRRELPRVPDHSSLRRSTQPCRDRYERRIP